jgi:alpha-beta hydrolase superfamily lysophospholipase
LKKGKIVIMGHSTGSQDVMEYLLDRSKSLHPVDGGIIQAPVSDREGMKALMRPGLYQHSVDAALKMVESGKGEDIMPSDSTECFFGPMVSARRWLSLASPNKDGDDDYFSSDLKDEQLARTFGSLPPKSPLLILCSGSDEYMPLDVEKQALLDRWIKFIKAGTGKVDAVNSGIIANATHNLKRNPEDVVQELVTRVLQYLLSLSKTVGSI